MNIIIPMAGRGTRMRPHTLTTPKPLLPIAGKPIVHRLIEQLTAASEEPITNIGFIIAKDFGQEVENSLLKLASKMGAKGHIFYQESPRGIAHALYTAKDLFEGKIIIGLSDTLFLFDQKLSLKDDGVLLVQKVEDPTSFGVVSLDDEQHITSLIEKPKEFVSDLAIIGIYYFKEAKKLLNEIEYLLENQIKTKGEFQLTDAIENYRKKGAKLKTQTVNEWLDCGNKDVTINTNQRILKHETDKNLIEGTIENINSAIIPPCYIAKDVVLENTIIGPYVSIGEQTVIKNSIISNSIIQANSVVENKILKNSMLGNYVNVKGRAEQMSIGDYSFNEK